MHDYKPHLFETPHMSRVRIGGRSRRRLWMITLGVAVSVALGALAYLAAGH